MLDKEKELAKEVIKFLEGADIDIEAFEDYDDEENYAGTRYYLARAGIQLSLEVVYDTQFERSKRK